MTAHRALEDAYLADHTIADPGNAGEIQPSADLGIVQLVTAAAETRTLPDPLKAGIRLALTLMTDGGDCVVTASTAVNATGNNTLTFAEAGDVVDLLSIPDGASGSFMWRVVGNDGVALSTV